MSRGELLRLGLRQGIALSLEVLALGQGMSFELLLELVIDGQLGLGLRRVLTALMEWLWCRLWWLLWWLLWCVEPERSVEPCVFTDIGLRLGLLPAERADNSIGFGGTVWRQLGLIAAHRQLWRLEIDVGLYLGCP